MNKFIKSVDNVNLEGVVACLPSNRINNEHLKDIYTREEIKQISTTTGVKSRYFVPSNIKTSDLCLKAASHLINKLKWEKNSIDGLIFITQTPDNLIPATSNSLQNSLGLSSNSFAIDINLGCSAYPYGLWVASSLMQTGAKRILILVGDTISKIVNKEDRSTAFLFGDAGSASALSIKENNPIKFILGSDGSGSENIKAQYSKSLKMNGAKVFEFSLSRIPSLVKEIDSSNGGPHEIYFFHQANKFMLNYLKKKCKLNDFSLPINIEEYGNTSSASIPLLMVDTIQKEILNKKSRVALIGFGVGFSWSAASLSLSKDLFLDKIFFPAN